MTISVVLITYNDAGRIRPCLESVRWANEIVVVDLSSTDNTPAICREFGAGIHTRPWRPYADPLRNEAIGLARGEWVLMLDADERVTAELAEALQAIAARDEVDVALVPFWFMVFGRPRSDLLARFDAIARFFRKGALRWPVEVHGRPDLTGLRQIRLDAEAGQYILHDGWRTTREILDRIDRYTVEEAQLLHARGERFSVPALLRETLREVGRGLIYQDYRDGAAGLVRVGFVACYRFCVWARLWELEGYPRKDDCLVERWGGRLGAPVRLAFRVQQALKRRRRAGAGRSTGA